MAHAIERLYFHICNKAGFDWIKIAQKELLKSNDGRVIPIQQESDLHQYFEQHIIKMNELEMLIIWNNCTKIFIVVQNIQIN